MKEQLTSQLDTLCDKLSGTAAEVDVSAQWPANQIRWLAEAEVYKWFVPREFGGHGCDEGEILDGYLRLSQSCLTTTFILTQWNAACKRILSSENVDLKQELLPSMATGELFATVGISHLTTSRQHVAKPVLAAEPLEDGGYLLNGFSPWVTAAPAADVFVIGATLPDGRQVLGAVSSDTDGVEPNQGASLVALNSSCTDQVRLENVRLSAERVLAGPVERVLQANAGSGAGGLQTSTLAVGLSMAAAGFLRDQSEKRTELIEVAKKISADCDELRDVLRNLTLGHECKSDASELRQRANSLVLRSTQAALSAAKGAGFVSTHPAGRWAREALFFLVWSCPQPVVNANLCELAQLA